MTRPTFLIIGAMKCGTTSLWSHLRNHPQVRTSDRKELDFFSRNWDRGWSWYESQFDDAQGGSDRAAVGEASPSYAELHYYPDVPERIATHLPDVRLVYLVRDPIARVRSHYLHNVYGGFEHETLTKAVRSSETYVGIGRYATHIDAYLSRFPRDQLLIVRSEQLQHDLDATLGQVARFLGIDPAWSSSLSDEDEFRTPTLSGRIRLDFRTRGKRTVIRAVPGHIRLARRAHMFARVRRDLATTFRPEVERLRQYLDPQFDGWGIG